MKMGFVINFSAYGLHEVEFSNFYLQVHLEKFLSQPFCFKNNISVEFYSLFSGGFKC